MIIIRLQRIGRKNDPSFRVIVTDSKRAAKTGNYLEMVGSYDPRTDRVALNAERIKHWMSEGAKVSDTLHNLLVSQKILEGKKKNVLPKKTAPKKEEAPAAPPNLPAAPLTNAGVSAPLGLHPADLPLMGATSTVAKTVEAAPPPPPAGKAAGGEGAAYSVDPYREIPE